MKPLGGSLAGVRVWDGERDLGPVTVHWRADRIEAVDPAEDLHPGLTVVPGLVDTHVHLDTSVLDGAGPGDAWPLVTPPEEKALHVAAHTQRFAAAGITTLRDLASSPVQMAVARSLSAGVLPGARLVTAGAVGMTAGHGDLFTPPRFRERPPVADTPDECRRLVRQWAREGSQHIKVYCSGGILSMGDQVGWRNQTRAELEATLDEAHALGMLVAAHTHTATGIDLALDLGVDSVEHATGLVPRQFDRLLERQVPVAPTILVNDLVAAGGPGIRPEARDKARAATGARDEVFAAAGAAGVRFVLGTDANARFVGYGDQFSEVHRMRELFGWDAARALRSATSDAAAAIGLGDSVGRLAPGYVPDLLLVRGTPWQDIEDLRTENVVAVLSRGRLVAGELP
ncbi:amidohydrolase family protein [Kineococcus rhizosphaerae]|uniref:Pro-Hyp dipeptidase n=1 Tax=Kineococcus rhizosphaerae TaxID=559628 RepID=A0A2T0R7T1_9ACTN|nr:amidohydrolase family protein [Kineococcus rhizosphaerae]PRY17229.1 Pro-Hyp dipeptidase [Kineococcus rhizosphaerae]